MSTKTIITPSFAIYNIELEQAFKDGWRIDHDNLPNTWGIVYEALLIKDEHREDVLSAFLPDAIIGNAVADCINVQPIIPQPTPELRIKGGRPRKA